MGEGRFATAREVAAFMGICSRSGPYCVASRYYTNFQLCKLIAESVHSKVADFAATVASHYLGPGLHTVGSMYSGAFDELGTGCQRMVPGLRRSFVSEIDPSKLRILWESFGPDRCYGDVCEIDGCFPADILVASPPCLVFSKANRVSAPSDRLAEAASQVASIRRVISLLAPSAVILEQTEGLKTHCSEAYSLYEGLWGGLAIRCTIPLSMPTPPAVAPTIARNSSGSPFGPSPRPCSDWVPVWLPGYCTQACLCLPPLHSAICSWPLSVVCAAELSSPGGCPPGLQPLLSPGLPGLLVGLVCMCRDAFPSSHYHIV